MAHHNVKAIWRGRSEELKKGERRFDDEFDAEKQTARIVKGGGSETPTMIVFWFAWYAFHRQTDVHEAQ